MESPNAVPVVSDVPTVFPSVNDVEPVPDLIDYPDDDILDAEDLDEPEFTDEV